MTSVPDKLRGEAIVAYVVPADPDLTIQELVNFAHSSPYLSDYKCPRWYRIVDSIPLNATGKKMHRTAKEMAAKDLENGLLAEK